MRNEPSRKEFFKWESLNPKLFSKIPIKGKKQTNNGRDKICKIEEQNPEREKENTQTP
jgi:hypothetical protein